MLKLCQMLFTVAAHEHTDLLEAFMAFLSQVRFFTEFHLDV